MRFLNILRMFFEVFSTINLLPKVIGVSNTALMHFDNNAYSLYERDVPYKLNIDFNNKGNIFYNQWFWRYILGSKPCIRESGIPFSIISSFFKLLKIWKWRHCGCLATFKEPVATCSEWRQGWTTLILNYSGNVQW